MPLLEVRNLKKIYTTHFGGHAVQALCNVSFSIEAGEYVAIMGESGSGKTTLLNILASLDRPTGGELYLNGQDMLRVPEGDLALFRRKNLGFVFQDFNLLDTFSVQDNILLPLVLAGEGYREMSAKLTPLAQRLRLSKLLDKFPYEISGGQKQRTAVAWALITSPQLILADEPTVAGFPVGRRSTRHLFRDSRAGADDLHGHALRAGSQPRLPRPVHPGRRGVPSALSRRAVD